MRKLIVLFLAASLLLACNLTTVPPTPTARPGQATAPPANGAPPTLFASITPLPGFGGVATQAPNPNCPVPPGWIQYTVEGGDSIGALAEATGVTIQDIVNGNCLADPDTLYTGQVIYLPRSPISG